MNNNNTPTPSEPLTYGFAYNGLHRVVANAIIKDNADGTQLLVGWEVLRGSKPSKGVKAFRVDRIEGELETVS